MTLQQIQPFRGRRVSTELQAKQSDAVNPIHAAYYDFLIADRVWSVELEKAFGKQAGNRRYDMDKSQHPASCNAAHAAFCVARDNWQAAVDASRLAS